ncbi:MULTISPECIES: GPW/gp25 family protein [Rahnella]|jgi:phage baseplate assembly protein W|uniref:GPW/gp25 family protein n=1 Tax=Rahnella sp. (strain Y9602) TaxID=2703885 RepID=A0A0H3F8N6_RAHSY|nr:MULTISPECIES: GPW/gp25 family protein [Rahnella]AFE56926.1 GPW/gp25 family protein [Rahnella aquatilis HX2]AYA05698.1 baseplate assembly protein [Rahnella aquatilis]ADW72345.1 GPW/gp25 family protein [Rahnella aceris]AZP40938.1 baseplate assembly protein [Rahnella aquatilis]AZP45279.1 baseplate assembly protein [Rahnella aquatilis]
MSNPKYLGMNRNSGMAIEDLDHIRQSVSDILNTPVGSRVMRRNYGSLLSELIDQPQNGALQLQMMAICYTALLQWEPRISLNAITFETDYTGKMVVELTGSRNDTATDFSLNIPVS